MTKIATARSTELGGAGFPASFGAARGRRGARPPEIHTRTPPLGAHEVLAEMRAVGGAEASDAALLEPGTVQEAVRRRRRLACTALWCVYTDLRGPNVLVECERVSPRSSSPEPSATSRPSAMRSGRASLLPKKLVREPLRCRLLRRQTLRGAYGPNIQEASRANS